jgi:D-alanyl-D-alanine carboxypeptidase (penicillin-binding protein 5/6)
VDPVFRCEQAFVYDVNRGCFLYISEGDQRILPASTTKLLTILYAVTLLPLDKEISPGNELEMVGPNSSTAYIKSHHVLTVEQLIEGMLLPSGNDAAHVLAAAGGRALKPSVKDGKEAVAVFMEGMNAYGKKLGLTDSHFITPDGYDTQGHYSSLADMAIVARAAYACPVIRKYCNLERDDVVYASGHQMTWKNTNINLWKGTKYYSPYVNGLKTGSVSSEYYCLLSSAEIEGRPFLFGFFGEKNSDDRFIDTLTAIEWVKKYA